MEKHLFQLRQHQKHLLLANQFIQLKKVKLMFLQLEIKPTFQLKLFQESIEVYSNQNKNQLLNQLFKSTVNITFQLLTKLLSQLLLIKLPIFQYTKLQILLIFLKLLIQLKKDQLILSKLEIKLTFLLMSFQKFIVHFSNQLKNHHLL